MAQLNGMDIWIDSHEPLRGHLTVEWERIDITSGRDVYGPDPKWEFVDKAGHWHAWAADGKHPTMQKYEKQMPCNGRCIPYCGGEGYSETRYRCRICEKRIKPGMVITAYAGEPKSMSGQMSWSVVASGRDQLMGGEDVTVRCVVDGTERFGLARRVMTSFDSSVWTYEFQGISELGLRAS